MENNCFHCKDRLWTEDDQDELDRYKKALEFAVKYIEGKFSFPNTAMVQIDRILGKAFIDTNIPDGEIHFKNEKCETVGKIVNIGKEEE